MPIRESSLKFTIPEQTGQPSSFDVKPIYSPLLPTNLRLLGPPSFGAFRDDFAARAEQARSTVMQVTPESLRLISLSQAAEQWWQFIKRPTVRKQRTIEAYELYLKNIRQSEIGKLKTSALHLGHLLEFQKMRRQRACVSYVNHETNLIAQVLKYCDLWEFIGKHFRQLPPAEWRPPKVLTHDEEERFFRVAASNPDWSVAYWTVSLTNNTSAAGSELRTLQLKHIFIEGEWQHNPKIHIPDRTAKNQFRARVIPLNEVALHKLNRILERARSHGLNHPEHYLFPKRIARNRYDVTQPASRSFIRKAFKEMREATGFPWLQPRNFRNQVITKLFENGTPDETIMAIAGHQSINMSRYYSQIRMDAKKEALSALVEKKAVKRA
jgi:integrase